MTETHTGLRRVERATFQTSQIASSAMAAPTKHDFASYILGRPVHEWIADQRAAGRTWRQIAADLEKATGGRISVVPETVRSWALGNRMEQAA